MAKIIDTASGAYALTFDDVLLQPGASEIMPAQTDITTRIARDIELSLPILSAAMDTVTESRLAIAMAQAGGIGIIHRNLNPEEQAEEVRQVKKFESGMVVNPITIRPDATLAGCRAGCARDRVWRGRCGHRGARPVRWPRRSPRRHGRLPARASRGCG